MHVLADDVAGAVRDEVASLAGIRQGRCDTGTNDLGNQPPMLGFQRERGVVGRDDANVVLLR